MQHRGQGGPRQPQNGAIAAAGGRSPAASRRAPPLDLRDEWRALVEVLNARIRRLDTGLDIDKSTVEQEEAAREWRLMLISWRDETLDLLRRHTAV